MKRLAFVLLLLPVAASARFITESDLRKFKWIADPQVSPDGTRVAYVVVSVNEKGDGYETAIWLAPTTAGATPRALTRGPRDSSPRWSPDGKTIAFLRPIDKEAQIHLLSLDGGEPRALTSMPKSAGSITWSPNGDRIAFTSTVKPSDFEPKKEGERESDVRVVTLATFRQDNQGYDDPSRMSHIFVISSNAAEKAKATQLTSGEFDEDDIAWSADGSRIYFTSARRAEAYLDPADADVYAVPAGGGDIARIVDTRGPIRSIAPSPDGKWLAFAGYETDHARSYDEPDLFIAPANGGAARNLTATYDGDILGAVTGDQHPPRANRGPRFVWSADSKTLFTTSVVKGTSNLSRVDVASGRIEPWTRGNREVFSFSRGGGKTIAAVSTPTMISELFAVDDAGTLTQLTRINEALFSEIALTEPEELWYDSFDGKKIETWIQKPPDFDPAKKYPLILNIHGGPHAAYGYSFFHELQWMAAKGYVVVYPNPRGSSSYGEEFGNVIQYKYPGDDYKDLMAAVDAVIARGYIDPKKLAVTGGSGGGVLTNWTITQTDRFAAAASQRSISDWASWWYTADFTMFQPEWFRKKPWEDPQEFASRSALTFVERIKTPVMFVEGESDYRTPSTAGGEALFRALKFLRRPTVMVRFPSEPHELSRSGNPWHRIERLQHIVGWFDHWLLGKKNEAYERGLRK